MKGRYDVSLAGVTPLLAGATLYDASVEARKQLALSRIVWITDANSSIVEIERVADGNVVRWLPRELTLDPQALTEPTWVELLRQWLSRDGNTPNQGEQA